MKRRHRLPVVILIVISCFCLSGMPFKKCLAEQNQSVFEKDTYYDIYYGRDSRTQYVINIKIIGTVTISGIEFLEIQSSSIPTNKAGYIAFSSILAILPTGSPKPQVLK